MNNKVVMWFRQDLRLSDNPALSAAVACGSVIPVYILDGSIKDQHLGRASRWWLNNSLKKLDEKLRGNLNVYKGNSLKVLERIVKAHGVKTIFASTCYEPGRREQDEEITQEMKRLGVEMSFFNGSLLWEPAQVLKEDGTFYRVFTPFYKNAIAHGPTPRIPLPAPEKFTTIKDSESQFFNELELLDEKNPVSYAKYWQPGEDAALRKLASFIEHKLEGYAESRDFADKDQTSHLSPYLHFGEISPNTIWYEMQKEHVLENFTAVDREKFLTELCWREFSHTLLFHFPEFPKKNFQKKFDNFPWKSDEKLLHAWQYGRTGYPIVDAGMRQLLQTGYMHNRVRMIVASFLTKNLMQFWGHGAQWFHEHLVDADVANNSVSWQWVAGSGVDAAPYFRIFNPVTQGEKFDPTGSYIKKYIPELKKMPQKHLFSPWRATSIELRDTEIVIGRTYPSPMVEIEDSRKRALMAYEKLRS